MTVATSTQMRISKHMIYPDECERDCKYNDESESTGTPPKWHYILTGVQTHTGPNADHGHLRGKFRDLHCEVEWQPKTTRDGKKKKRRRSSGGGMAENKDEGLWHVFDDSIVTAQYNHDITKLRDGGPNDTICSCFLFFVIHSVIS